MRLFEVQDLQVKYGNIEAVKGISLHIDQDEKCIAIVGPNGAGKSTFVNAVTGLVEWAGEVLFAGQSIRGLSNRRLVQTGLVQCPERRYLFDFMSVKDNLLLGAYNAPKDGTVSIDQVFDLFPVLRDRVNQQAGTLSGGEAQMVAIGRALMASPKLLFLDEPTLGLAPIIRKNLIEALKEIGERGDIAVCLIEQNVKVSFEVAHRVYLMREGRIVKSGLAEELEADSEIQKVFLGV